MTEIKNIDKVMEPRLGYPEAAPEEIKSHVSLIINGVEVLQDNPELLAAFQKLCFKGINTWSNAPKDLKKLVDYIWNGKLVQDYNNLPERKPEHTTEGIQHAERIKG